MTKPTPKSKNKPAAQHIAIIGAGMAGITAARTLAQAGHNVTVFEKSAGMISAQKTGTGKTHHAPRVSNQRRAVKHTDKKPLCY